MSIRRQLLVVACCVLAPGCIYGAIWGFSDVERFIHPGPPMPLLAYKDSLIVERSGHTACSYGWTCAHWEAQEEGTFTLAGVKAFLEEYKWRDVQDKWRFVGERSFTAADVNRWEGQGPTFPMRLEIEGETGCLSHHGERFTRRITTGATVLIFDTGWTKHGPKPDFPAYAYVMISHDGRQMSLYHEWGGGDFCCCCMPVVAVDALARWVFSDLLRIK